MPQQAFLLEEGRTIPLDYLGRSEFSCEARELLLTRLGANHLSRTKLPLKAQQTILAHVSSINSTQVWPSLQETRRLCVLYRMDYQSLHLPMPRVCMPDIAEGTQVIALQHGIILPSFAYLNSQSAEPALV